MQSVCLRTVCIVQSRVERMVERCDNPNHETATVVAMTLHGAQLADTDTRSITIINLTYRVCMTMLLPHWPLTTDENKLGLNLESNGEGGVTSIWMCLIICQTISFLRWKQPTADCCCQWHLSWTYALLDLFCCFVTFSFFNLKSKCKSESLMFEQINKNFSNTVKLLTDSKLFLSSRIE